MKRADKKVDPEKVFRAVLEQEDFPQPESEYRFTPERRFRFDYAWVSKRVALEVEGGIWIQGRHSRGAGMISDMQKYNLATLMGWKVLRTTPDMLCLNGTLDMLRIALELEAA